MNKQYLSLTLAAILLTACGGGSSSSSNNDGKGSIDLHAYYPNVSMTKTFISTERYGDDIDKSHYDEIINVNGETITYTVDTKVVEKVVFTDRNITSTSIDDNKTEVSSMFRHVDLGDTIFSQKMNFNESNDLGQITTALTQTCKLKSKEEKFEKSDNVYTGDLLKIECIVDGEVVYDVKQTILDAGVALDLNGTHAIYDKSYIYLQKDLGEVAFINDDCVTNKKLPMVVNDKAESKECKKIQYDYEFYIP
jgi:hypothetical protein